MSSKARIRALQALVAGSSSLGACASVVDQEFCEVHAVRKIRRAPRRRLLELLHSARALDTALAEFVAVHKCKQNGQSMGSYLIALETHKLTTGLGNLPKQSRIHFQKTIVDERNRYLHQAGAFPNSDPQIDILLSEIHTCLSTVIGL